jgi:hypothetical protein
MSAPKPRETCRNLRKKVSLPLTEKSHRNLRNHSLKGEAKKVSPLARGHLLLRSRHSSATPLGASLAGRPTTRPTWTRQPV